MPYPDRGHQTGHPGAPPDIKPFHNELASVRGHRATHDFRQLGAMTSGTSCTTAETAG
jgi:hypothetical protein